MTIAAPSAAGQADTVTLSAAVAGDAEEFRQLAAPYRRELLVHCYRMLNELSNYGGAYRQPPPDDPWKHQRSGPITSRRLSSR